MLATLIALILSVFAPVADLPACEYEDGSTQALCVWTGGANGEGQHYVSYDYGAYQVYEDGSVKVY